MRVAVVYDEQVAGTIRRYDIAAERVAYILTRDPNYPGAAEGLAQARAALLTPAPDPLVTPEMTPTPEG